MLLDCDVDAPDLHLLLHPEKREEHEFWSGMTAVIDDDKCNQCGLCQTVCRQKAIADFSVDALSCEGCGFCYRVCPVGAVSMKDVLSGHWFVSDTRYGTLVHASLGAGRENSGKLVATVRQHARLTAEKTGAGVIISDGPPGTGCPVISSLSGADLALLVTEPTMSGMHDLKRVLEVCRHFGVTALACINKYDINEDKTREVEEWCSKVDLEVGGRIPFDEVVTEATVNGKPVTEMGETRAGRGIRELWRLIVERMQLPVGELKEYKDASV